MLEQMHNVHKEYSNYILHSFNLHSTREQTQATDISLSFLKDSSLVVFLPRGLCRACFSSLLIELQDNHIPGDRVYVISDGRDYEVQFECIARGVHYSGIDAHLDGLHDIILTRYYRGYFPVQMLYDLGREKVFKLFISDDEKLFYSLSGMY